MGINFKRKMKIILAIILIITILIMLKININSKINIASVKETTSKSSIIEVKAGSKVYEANDTSQEKNIVSENNNKTKKEVEIITQDTKAPDNIESIETKVLENNVIISFNKPKDNGNNYEYIVENNDRKENLNFYAESGFLGYSYKITNNEEDQAENKVNKIDDSPIVVQNLDWNKNYYLHIKTVDNNQNFSENKTLKIDLPSNGVNIEYVDFNSNKTLAIPEKISGMINDNYNASDLKKEISDYTLVETTGNQEGLLQKEAITVKYKYAKNANLSIKYIDKLTGKEIAPSSEIQGYEGKSTEITPKEISGFTCENKISNIRLNAGDNEIKFIYNKTGKVIVSYIDEFTNQKLSQDEIKVYSYGEEYNTLPKKFSNYELTRTSENVNGVIDEDTKYIYYYYKPSIIVSVKYVDFDTNDVLLEDKIVGNEGSNIKYKIKKIEGYKLVKDIQNPDDEEESIIDEIIQSLSPEDDYKEIDLGDSLTEDERKNIKDEYEIVMNCDNSDYIIYYKKEKKN